ncbi:hypothetical protein HY945_04990 [Candidatus Gottesmanbacteria bacterium]|nr:hypothetical protein [Candidatus Gottesmanbacteria bacterium]
MAKYPYLLLPSSKGYVVKPMIKVRLGYKKTHKIIPIPIPALIDSGADVCFCSKDIGMWLGIDFRKKESKEFRAADNQNFPTYNEKVTLYACHKQYDCYFYFSDTLPKDLPIILGLRGFFDHFHVCFDQRSQTMDIN